MHACMRRTDPFPIWQLSTYDVVKAALVRRTRLADGLPLHVASSFVTGVAVVLAMQARNHRL